MVKRWLTSKELIDRWQAEPFEILEAHKNGLPFYVKSGKIVTYPLTSEDHKTEKLNSVQRKELEKKLEKLDEYLLDNIFLDCEPIYDPYEQAMGEDVEVAKFKLTDIEAYEQKHGIFQVIDEAIQEDIQKGQQKFIDVPEGTTWNEIFVRVVPDERIEFEYLDNDTIFTYRNLGLDKKPRLTEILEQFAKQHFFEYEDREKSNITNLRKIFKKLFPNIKKDPFPIRDKNRDKKWKPAFHISISESE